MHLSITKHDFEGHWLQHWACHRCYQGSGAISSSLSSAACKHALFLNHQTLKQLEGRVQETQSQINSPGARFLKQNTNLDLTVTAWDDPSALNAIFKLTRDVDWSDLEAKQGGVSQGFTSLPLGKVRLVSDLLFDALHSLSDTGCSIKTSSLCICSGLCTYWTRAVQQ